MLSDRMPIDRDLARMWQGVLGRLQVEIMPSAFETWLRGTRALRQEGATLVVEGGRPFECEQLNGRLQVVVRRAAQAVFGEELDVHFVPADAGELDGWQRQASARPAAAARALSILGSMNCSYTFERYLPAAGNRVALQCCMSLFDADDVHISPIVVWGSPGMGKSHLLNAVACKAAEAGWQVTCVTAEEFTTRYQQALRRGEVDAFQANMRGSRLFVLDDLQYLTGKRGTQDEFAHTIDAVMAAGGHVAIGSERHPAELDFSERLVSRLQAGIVTHMEPFRLEERQHFIARVAQDRRTALPAWAAERIAHLEVPSVRVLQGAVNAAIALARAGMLEAGRLDADLMRVALADAAPRQGGDERALVEAVARHFEASFEDLVGRSRKANVTKARSVVVALLRDRGRSLTEIATVLGGRDKSTISQLAERGRAAIEADAALRRLAG